MNKPINDEIIKRTRVSRYMKRGKSGKTYWVCAHYRVLLKSPDIGPHFTPRKLYKKK